MIYINFKDYRENYSSMSTRYIWEKYHHLFIQNGGVISINNKKPIINISKYYQGIGGGILCSSNIVFINKDFKEITKLQKNDILYVALLFYEEDNTAVIIYFNIIFDISNNRLIEKKNFTMTFTELKKTQIFKIENSNNVKIIYQKVKKWLHKHQNKIIKYIEKNYHYKNISKCLDKINTELFGHQIKMNTLEKKNKPRLLPLDIKNIKTIDIPSQISSDESCNYTKDQSLIKTNIIDTDSNKRLFDKPLIQPNFKKKFTSVRKYVKEFSGESSEEKLIQKIYPKRISYSTKLWSKDIPYHPPFFSINQIDNKYIPNYLNTRQKECLLSDTTNNQNKYQIFWADPLDISLIPQTSEEIKTSFPWNKSYCSLNPILKIPLKERKSITGKDILFDGLLPLNPTGRTGLAGKGCLPRWGANITIGIVTIFKDTNWKITLGNDFEVDKHLLIEKNITPENNNILFQSIFMNFLDNIKEDQLISIVPKDIIKDLLDEKKEITKLYYKRDKFKSSEGLNACKTIELLVSIIFNNRYVKKKIFQDVWFSYKNTDNAWLESQVYVLNLSKKTPELTLKQWKIFLKLYRLSINNNKKLGIYPFEDMRKSDNISNKKCMKEIQKIIGDEYRINQKKNDLIYLLNQIEPNLELKFFGDLEDINKLYKNIIDYQKEIKKDTKLLEVKNTKFQNLLKKIVNHKIWNKQEKYNKFKLKTILGCQNKNFFSNKKICKGD